MIIGTIKDLKEAIAQAPDEQRVNFWYHDVGKYVVAIGVSGENTDYSFYIADDPAEAKDLDNEWHGHMSITDRERQIDPNPADWDNPGAAGASRDDSKDTNI